MLTVAVTAAGAANEWVGVTCPSAATPDKYIYKGDGTSDFLLKGAAFRACRVTNGAAIASEASAILWDSETYDLGTNFVHTTGIFTAPVAGVYSFSANVLVVQAIAVTTDIGLTLWKNGARLQILAYRLASNRANSDLITGTATIRLAVGDTIQLRPIGATMTVYGADGAGQFSYFSGDLVRAD
jgi:hypothetical protein